MDLLHLVDRLEELVATAQKMPIGSRAIVDRRRMLDIVDQMRIAIPEEVRQAQEMVEQREAIRRRAEEEAGVIIARAEQHAARIVEAHEITVAARARAEEIARQAEARLQERIEEANRDIQDRIADSRQLAEEQMNAADDYARELLQRLARQLNAFVRSVETGISQLEPAQPTGRETDARPSYDVDDEDYDTDEGYGESRAESDPLSEYDQPSASQHPLEEATNLLSQRSPHGRAVPDPQAVGVRARGEGADIDDFEIPELDDDPNRSRGQ